jgi:hypothetical protein
MDTNTNSRYRLSKHAERQKDPEPFSDARAMSMPSALAVLLLITSSNFARVVDRLLPLHRA